MEKTININGNRPIEILDGLKSIEVLKEYSALDSTATKFEVVFNTPEPTFEVGMRVECKSNLVLPIDGNFTKREINGL